MLHEHISAERLIRNVCYNGHDILSVLDNPNESVVVRNGCKTN